MSDEQEFHKSLVEWSLEELRKAALHYRTAASRARQEACSHELRDFQITNEILSRQRAVREKKENEEPVWGELGLRPDGVTDFRKKDDTDPKFVWTKVIGLAGGRTFRLHVDGILEGWVEYDSELDRPGLNPWCALVCPAEVDESQDEQQRLESSDEVGYYSSISSAKAAVICAVEERPKHETSTPPPPDFYPHVEAAEGGS